MILAGLGYWGIGMPLGVALGFFTALHGRGIWVGLAVGLGVVAVLMTVRWARRDRLGLSQLKSTPAGVPIVSGMPLL